MHAQWLCDTLLCSVRIYSYVWYRTGQHRTAHDPHLYVICLSSVCRLYIVNVCPWCVSRWHCVQRAVRRGAEGAGHSRRTEQRTLREERGWSRRAQRRSVESTQQTNECATLSFLVLLSCYFDDCSSSARLDAFEFCLSCAELIIVVGKLIR